MSMDNWTPIDDSFFRPIVFPLLITVIVLFLFARWMTLRGNPETPRQHPCETYSNNLIKDVPVKCYSYFGVN